MPLSRRAFVASSAAACLGLARPRAGHECGTHAHHARRAPRGPHPTPRPGITAAKVPTAEQLGASHPAGSAFEAARAVPQVLDGIRCHCGCAELEGFYSLLSCFEDEAMARHCLICQGQARMARRLHDAGKTLDEIREAIDARYG